MFFKTFYIVQPQTCSNISTYKNTFNIITNSSKNQEIFVSIKYNCFR